ncbi:hypothetical protein BCR35DRAFT_305213 [Leucosporidium creatinivorum]|uniref:MYND-type domain-containing protein n=1 Tax=Leucosporidium creatinivorum TaxID=106004 RepID=A0A1Y2F2E1_9BASI|nr:hypothetical protein BCR35DRAFT_305213 [Leucosporidium creatinivorum]
MPIEVKQRSLGPDDPVMSFAAVMGAPPIGAGRLQQLLALQTYMYASLTPKSPKVAAFSIVSRGSDVLVAHCSATKRTTVSTPGKELTNWSSYGEQLKWLTDGKPGSAELLLIYLDGTSAPPNSLRSTLLALAEPMSIALDYDERASPSTAHLIEVSKINAVTTLIHASADKSLNHILTNPPPPEMFIVMICGALLLFQGCVAEIDRVPVPLWKRYDGQKGWSRLPILSDLARSLLQQARMDRFAGDGTRKGISRNTLASSIAGYIKDPSSAGSQSAEQAVLKTVQGLTAFGAFCAVCGKLGDPKKCGGCQWETYCSVAHQKEDWPHHKSWCKKNSKTTAK